MWGHKGFAKSRRRSRFWNCARRASVFETRNAFIKDFPPIFVWCDDSSSGEGVGRGHVTAIFVARVAVFAFGIKFFSLPTCFQEQGTEVSFQPHIEAGCDLRHCSSQNERARLVRHRNCCQPIRQQMNLFSSTERAHRREDRWRTASALPKMSSAKLLRKSSAVCF